MDLKLLNSLAEMFSNGSDLFWITDKTWKIQKGKYLYDYPQPLPELLKIDPDCWDNIEKDVYLNGKFMNCILYCNKIEEIRVVILKEKKSEMQKSEKIALDTAVHSLRQIKEQLEEEIPEKKEMFAAIERNYYLLYQKSYIKTLIDSVYSGNVIKIVFSVQDLLRQIHQTLKLELRQYAEVSLQMPEEEAVLHESPEFFKAMFLAAMILCHRERGCFQHVEIFLQHSGSRAELQINLIPDLQHEINMSKQIDSYSFGSEWEEKKLLDIFCMIHGGSWHFMEQFRKNQKVFSCRIAFDIISAKQELGLYSPNRIQQREFDDVCRIMLSRIYLYYF